MATTQDDVERTASTRSSTKAESLQDKDVEKQPDTTADTSNPIITDNANADIDPNIVTWDGPNDPANPMNWTTSKKVAAIGIVSFITLLSPLASTMISPATAQVMATFHSSNETLGAFITSVYLLGYAFGPLVIAPLSELYGRSIIYNVCNVLFVIFTVACAVANNMGALIVFRLFAGIAASSPITLGAGTIADMVPVERRGLAMASWIMGPLIGPTVGPLAGGYLADAKGWRWIFWLIAIVGGAACILTAAFMRESYAYQILKHKTERLQKETGNMDLRSALDTGKSPKDLFRISIVRPIRMLLFSPVVFIISLFLGIIYGYMYLLFTTFPRIFEGQYGFSERSIGLTYLGVGVGAMIGLGTMGAISDRIVTGLTKRHGGKPKPEYRLPAMLLGAIVVPAGLFLYGWTAEKKVHYIAPIIGSAFLGAGVMLTFMSGQTYLVDAYTVYAASVTAAATVFRSLLGALLPLAGDSMYNALGVGWGSSLLGFIGFAFVPVVFLFYIYGEGIRNGRFSQVQF
ncbi:MFS general substrate transporter [Lentithecium fluviatile CBS 122367]|uniref:MFS general substrate transporter n=1 Tax=Lentithecium fluviatile CBS 122367 TaxID=1168545 RepID=A0A6G1IL07_9PLEO|nr:MFS general substrate transporter [Lentithecium fluviatile CBS 122367]